MYRDPDADRAIGVFRSQMAAGACARDAWYSAIQVGFDEQAAKRAARRRAQRNRDTAARWRLLAIQYRELSGYRTSAWRGYADIASSIEQAANDIEMGITS